MRAVYSVLAVAFLACKADERRSTIVTPPPSAPEAVAEPPPAPAETLRVPGGKEPIDGCVEIRVYSARDFLAAWEKTEPAALARNFPPSPPFYRISGDLITIPS